MVRGKTKKGEVFVIDGSKAGRRLDTALTMLVPEVSRSLWRKAILAGHVVMDGRSTRPAQKTIFGSRIEVSERPHVQIAVLQTTAKPEIIYYDNDVIVINKPSGLISHPKPGRSQPSVAAAFADMVDSKKGFRPGIVHRLDQQTSGIMILARNELAQKHLKTAFMARRVEKIYWALVWGEFGIGVKRLRFGLSPAGKGPGSMRVDPLGKSAETLVRQLGFGKNVSLIEAQPRTGRTHQIRVHLAAINHPILGDKVYGRTDDLPRQMLHARSLALVLPSGERRAFEVAPPTDFLTTMSAYGVAYE